MRRSYKLQEPYKKCEICEREFNHMMSGNRNGKWATKVCIGCMNKAGIECSIMFKNGYAITVKEHIENIILAEKLGGI